MASILYIRVFLWQSPLSFLAELNMLRHPHSSLHCHSEQGFKYGMVVNSAEVSLLFYDLVSIGVPLDQTHDADRSRQMAFL